ncbi:MAG: PKD domain-containing protein, partial [Bacteroidota bacterium]
MRGPKGHDEVNQARGPGFFGWPFFVADNKAYRDFDFSSGTSGEEFDPQAPINNSPNNTGPTNLPPAQQAFIWYPYDNAEDFGSLGTGGRNAMAAGVYYPEDYGVSPDKLPEYYSNKLIIYDWMRGWMRAVTMNEAGDYRYMEPFLEGMELNNVIDFLFSPNGEVYLLEYGSIWYSQNTDARLVKIGYNGGNRIPIAQIAADRTVGDVPLTINFSSKETYDEDGHELKYKWKFGKGESSNVSNPTYTFEKPGYSTVQLVVTDQAGAKSEDKISVLAGNAEPMVEWQIEGNNTFFWKDQSVNYEVLVSDEEDGSTSDGTIGASDVSVTIDYLERGADMTLIAQGHQQAAVLSKTVSGKTLMENSDCSSCHQEKQRSIGPSYVEVAQRYEGDPSASDYLVGKIINGGAGVWGEQAMAAHPQLSSSDTRKMVAYILSLSKESSSTQQPVSIKGEYVFEPENDDEGAFVFTASYTDRGNREMPGINAQSSVVLRAPTVQAEANNGSNDAEVYVLSEEDYPEIEDEIKLVEIMQGGHIKFGSTDLTNVGGIDLDMVFEEEQVAPYQIAVMINGPDGRII